MTANGITLIILYSGVFGWIPIWVFFNGIVKVIRAFKEIDDDGYDRNENISDDKITSGKED